MQVIPQFNAVSISVPTLRIHISRNIGRILKIFVLFDSQNLEQNVTRPTCMISVWIICKSTKTKEWVTLFNEWPSYMRVFSTWAVLMEGWGVLRMQNFKKKWPIGFNTYFVKMCSDTDYFQILQTIMYIPVHVLAFKI